MYFVFNYFVLFLCLIKNGIIQQSQHELTLLIFAAGTKNSQFYFSADYLFKSLSAFGEDEFISVGSNSCSVGYNLPGYWAYNTCKSESFHKAEAIGTSNNRNK